MQLEPLGNLNLSSREVQIISDVVKILIKHLHPARVILFGSRAKGTAREGSDFDLAVDLPRPDLTSERKVSEEIEGIAGLYKVDIIYLKEVDEDFKRLIDKTGVGVYERRT